jgi:hypothetical protein
MLKICLIIATLAYLVVGILSSIMFGDFNKDNVLESFSVCYSPFVDIYYVAYSILLMIGVPVTFQPVKAKLLQLIKKKSIGW